MRFEVDKSDLAELQRELRHIMKYTNKQAHDLVKQVGRFSAVSAAKFTKPKSIKNQKANFRKLVPIPESMGYWYVSAKGSKKPFKISKKYTPKAAEKRGLIRVKKAILIQPSKGRKRYIPWYGKKDHSKKIFKIPYVGLAKLGWKKNLRKLDAKHTNESVLIKNARGVSNINRVKVRHMDITITNNVRYAHSSSPESARKGLRKGINRLRGTYKKRIEKKIQKELDRM